MIAAGEARPIAALAIERAERSPEATAIVEASGRRVSFAEIVGEARALAAGLVASGLQPGDTISFQLPNWREAVAINLAASLCGLRVNPVTPIYRGAELQFILANSASRMAFVPTQVRSTDFVQLYAAMAHALPGLRVVTVRGRASGLACYEDLLERSSSGSTEALSNPTGHKMVLYTSGTTGRAKGVLHSDASMFSYAAATADFWGLGGEDLMLMPSPVTHVTGYTFGMEMPFVSGTPALLMDRWDGAKAVSLIDRFGATASVAATPFLAELLRAARDAGSRLPSMRLFACGGAAVSPALIASVPKITERCRAFRIYGATEVPMVTKGFIEAEELALASTSDGRVVDYRVRAIDTSGRALAPGEEGEIAAKGPSMFLGYTDPEETSKALDAQGFFRTGDLGVVHANGAVVITGRLKDIIIRGGENLSPVEIENALERHAAIREAAVVAMPDDRLGEAVAAFLIAEPAQPRPAAREIAAHLDTAGLARQKIPAHIEFVEEFPRTASGKIRKDLLRARFDRKTETQRS
ncbi:MAG TPA: AMP-binding protein [Novosphingobium sp.]|nr:AMP-binding protein [Novosphingobium sp.]